MLTPNNLRWNYQSFSLYSKLNLIPVRFIQNFLLGGSRPMDSQGSSVWKRIGFKLVQVSFLSQTLFVSIRTGLGAHGSGHEDDGAFVPIMIIMTGAYLSMCFITFFTFDSERALNTKIYNEILKLRGKRSQLVMSILFLPDRDILDRLTQCNPFSTSDILEIKHTGSVVV